MIRARWRVGAGIGRALRAELLIAESEAGPAAYFLTLFLLLGAGFALGRGSAGTLFLQRFGVEYLPQALVALGAGIAISFFAYAAIADRMRPDRLLVLVVGLLLAVLLPLWLVMGWTSVDLSYPAYFVLFHVVSEILLLQATLYFGMSFDASQSKRLLPVALAGLQGGEMCGGLALTAMASAVPMQHLAALWGLLAAAAAALVLSRHRGGRHAPHASPARKSIRPWRAAAAQLGQGLRFARASPFLRNLALATFFMVVAVHVLEYTALVIYAGTFASEEELAIVFGLLTFTCGAITLLVQLFFSGKLTRRYGVRAMNLVFPIGLLAAFAALAVSLRVPAALAGSTIQRTLLPAMRNPSRALLFQALPDHMQGRARALSLAVVLPLGIVLAAFVVRAVPPHAQAWLLPLAGIAASIGYLVFSHATNAWYPRALLETLGEKMFVNRGHLGRLDPVRDHALVERMVEGIRHRDDHVALTYAHALATAFPAEAWRHVLERARLAGDAIRDRMIRLVADRIPPTQRGVLHGFLETADDHQRATILSTLFGARDPEARAWVERCLASGNPRLEACGIFGVHEYAMADRLDHARTLWRGLLESPEPSRRLAGLDLARVRPEPESIPSILTAHGSSDPRVRDAAREAIERHATIAGGALGAWALSHLGSRDPVERAAAVRCCIDLPQDELLRRAHGALCDPHPNVAATAVCLLAERQGAAFADAALEQLSDDALPPRAQRALLGWLLDNAAPPRRLAGYSMRRVREALDLARLLRRLSEVAAPVEGVAHELVSTALAERALESADLALLSLEGIEDRVTIRRVRAAITSRDQRHFARAIEALEGLSRRDIAVALRTTLEHIRGGSPEGPDDASGILSYPQALDYLSQYPDAFVRECARYGQLQSSPATA